MSTASLTADLIARTQEAATMSEEAPTLLKRKVSGRRSLVLTDEAAGHPFRAVLPPHVKRDLHDIPAESLWALTREDVQGAASVYFAATAAILTFIF